MTNKNPQLEALEKSLGTKLPANAKIEIVIHDLDTENAESVKGGGSFATATRTVALGTISTGAVKVTDQARIGSIIAGLDTVMCW